jgi:hypothetical protein
MPYAAENQISMSPIEVGIEITQEQYQEALAGIMSGQIVTVAGGFAVIDRPEPEPEPEPELTPEEQLAQAKQAATQKVLGCINAFLNRFTDGVPSAEVASWATKAVEAEKVLSGGTSAMIEAEAVVLGISEQALSENIQSNASAYAVIVSQVSGLRRTTIYAIDAAETPEAVDQAVEASLAKAQEMAQAHGLDFP